MLEAWTLVAALAVGAALSSMATSRRASNDDLRAAVTDRIEAIGQDDFVGCECVDGVCAAVERVNADRLYGATPEAARRAMVDDALAQMEARDAETAAYLAAQSDCRLRRCLADALRGVTIREAESAMTALDHLLEGAPDSLRDAEIVFGAHPLTLLEIAEQLRG